MKIPLLKRKCPSSVTEGVDTYVIVRGSKEEGRADVGIKRLFLPCCIKGKFYANLTLLHKGKILCQPRLAVTARQVFSIKRPCVNPVRSPIYPRYHIKGRFYAKCCN